MELKSWKPVLLPAIIIIIYSSVCDGTCLQFSLYYSNVKIYGQDNIVNVRSRIDCAFFCQSQSPCLSYAYVQQEQECLIYNRRLGRAENTTVYPGLLTFTAHRGNVARNQLASQSSVNGRVEYAYKGVDGHFGDGSKIQTYSDKPSWWCVDLWGNYDISHITLYNRKGHYAYRISSFRLHVSSVSGCIKQNMDSASLCFINDGQTKEIYNITSCHQPLSLDNVRTVYVSVNNEVLHFEELKIFPKEICLIK